MLNTLLESASYRAFWEQLDSDDLYADLVADVAGFEELMRVRIAVTVGQGYREVERGVLEGWLNLEGAGFERFVAEICGWGLDGGVVRVPVNKENEAKGTVVREEVRFDREFSLSFCHLGDREFTMGVGVGRSFANIFQPEFSRIIRRAYEQPA